MQSQIRKKPRKVKRFRFLYIYTWLTETYKPCRVGDIAGGKGLLSYLLNQRGWQSTVIDPLYQELPKKYTNLEKKRIKLPPEAKVPRITKRFSNDMAPDFDILMGLHAHGCNMQIIDAAAKYDRDFILLPCCVIDEPIEKRPDVDWRESLFEYAQNKGLEPKKVNFHFMGKSVAIYTDKHLKKIPNPNTELLNTVIAPLPMGKENGTTSSEEHA
jgi:hypothetical protein